MRASCFIVRPEKTLKRWGGCPGLDLIKQFSCSTQLSNEIHPAYNVKMPTIVGILTFINRMKTTSENFKARTNLYFCHHFLPFIEIKIS